MTAEKDIEYPDRIVTPTPAHMRRWLILSLCVDTLGGYWVFFREKSLLKQYI